ncbi:MAG TPA: LPS assembly lipoprotein LptE [Anaeromyxobacteraceae bacterium]|nr:LPS assembly lipoprotein LptE [Anaeromyxobacteraceae bacterium]
MLALLALSSACGYSLSAAGRLTGGVERASVLPFENLSTEPELGAVLSAALREELAARGALARGGSRTRVEGEVRVGVPSPAAPGGASWRVTLDVAARLVDGDRRVAERSLRRVIDYSAGVDALETEGRRTLALRTLAADCARELASSLME